MNKNDELKEIHHQYSVGEFSKLTGINVKTLQKYDRNGKIKAYRTDTGRRYYTKFQLCRYLGTELDESLPTTVIYTRAFGLDANFYNHKQAIEIQKYCDTKEIIISNIYSDVALGTDMNRPGLKRLIEDARLGAFNHLIVTDFSILSIFDSPTMFQMFNDDFGVEITVLHRRHCKNPYYLLEEIKFMLKQYSQFDSEYTPGLINEIISMQQKLLEDTPDPEVARRFAHLYASPYLNESKFTPMTTEEFANVLTKHTAKTHVADFVYNEDDDHTPKICKLPEIEPFTY